MKQYSEEVLELITAERTAGTSWAGIASDLNKSDLGYKYTAEGVRKAYRRYNDDEAEDRIDELAKARRSQVSALRARSSLNSVLDHINLSDDIVARLDQCIGKLNKVKLPPRRPLKDIHKRTPMTVEALLSDVQVGKKSPDYNVDIARKRVEKYGEALCFKIQQHIDTGYNVESIVIALMGDMIESSHKAVQKGEASSCEIETPEQITTIIELLWEYVILKVYNEFNRIDTKFKVICVPGNHDHTSKGMAYYKAGRNQVSWVIYYILGKLCDVAGLDIEFDISDGVFAVHDYYGNLCVYEHGYRINPTEPAMLGRLNQRTRQMGKYVTYFRMGDKHNITRFNEDTLVVNGAFFGSQPWDRGEEYSSVEGYSAKAGQLVFFHVPHPDEEERGSIFDSFIIQLSHVR